VTSGAGRDVVSQCRRVRLIYLQLLSCFSRTVAPCHGGYFTAIVDLHAWISATLAHPGLQ